MAKGFLKPDDFIPSLLSWFELYWPEIFSSYRTNQPLFYFTSILNNSPFYWSYVSFSLIEKHEMIISPNFLVICINS